MIRSSERHRHTKETDIEVALSVDGKGLVEASTGLPFFDHMLDQLGRHSGWDLRVSATGDLHVDAHHTVEDVGIVVGQALAEALGDKAGVRRFASIAPAVGRGTGRGRTGSFRTLVPRLRGRAAN